MTAAPSRWTLGATAAPRTLHKMAQLIREALPDPRVWQTAHRIVANVAERDQVAQVDALRAWVQSHFRFVDDPTGVELIPDPVVQLEGIERDGYWQGDCDDAAVLNAALVSAIGVPAALVAGAYDAKGPFQHVYAVAYPRSSAGSMDRVSVELDTTRPSYVPTLPHFARTLRLWVS